MTTVVIPAGRATGKFLTIDRERLGAARSHDRAIREGVRPILAVLYSACHTPGSPIV